MRDIPGYPAGVDSVEPVVRVVHSGKDREVESVSLSRELPSSFHAQVRGVGGMTQATGSVDWAPLADVVGAHPTGFNRANNWPPKTRDTVDVYTGVRAATGDLLAKQLTGFVSKSSGDPMEGVGSGLVDRIARLSRKVTLPPLLDIMPPLDDGGLWRGVSLFPTYFTDLAARAGGFYSTPAMSGGCVFSAPLMGSTWPERGTLVTAQRFSDRGKANAVIRETSWGMGMSDGYLTYQPWGNSTLDRPMEVTLLAGVSEAEVSVAVMWGAAGVRLVSDSRNATAWLDGPSGSTRIASLGGAPSPVTMRVSPMGGSLLVEIRDAAGALASGTVARPGEVNGNASHVQVNSKGFNAIIGGVQVSFPSSAWTAVNYTRTAFISPAAHNASLRASPPIMGRTAKSLLEEQSAAELAALWIDGDGNLHWISRNKLVSGAPVATLTSKDNLKSLPWEEDFAGVASMVEVVGRKAEAVIQSKYPVQEVWRSSYSKVEADGTDKVMEELLHPDTDEDWIMVDQPFNNDDAAGSLMRGSDIALYYFLESGTPGQAGYRSAEGYYRGPVRAQLDFIDHRTYKLTTTVYAASRGGYEKAEFSLKIPSEHQGLNGGGWGANLGGLSFPVVRAKARTMWADVAYTADAAGVWDAPVLTHDVSWWVQDPAACQAIADLLATSTTTPRPTLSGVSIVPDARLQLGDVVTLTDTDLTGVQFRCLIVGIDDSFTSGPTAWEQSCNFRILSTTTL